jgi:TRAP-type C4-dicarboxylate transport system permease small subunit
LTQPDIAQAATDHSLPAAASEIPVDDLGAARIEDQRRFLSPQWRRIDRSIMLLSEIGVFAIGALFTIMITLEVVSRYVLGFSIFFVNAAAKLLLVWFFLLGAGIALRHGAHVGFELLLALQSPRRRRIIILFGQFLGLVFFVEMIWGGVYALGPAMKQTEPGLDISTSKSNWASFSAEEQGMITTAMKTAMDWQWKEQPAAIADALAKLKTLIAVNEIAPDNKKLFIEATRPVYKQFEGAIGKDFLDLAVRELG